MVLRGGAHRFRLRSFIGAVVFAALVALPAAAPAATLDLIGQNNLGGDGLNGQIATIGNTVIVASGILPARSFHVSFYDGTYTCPPTTVKVVDVSTPSAPTVVSQIAVAPGLVASDVAALHVSTPSFTGDLLAVSLARCNSTTVPPGGVAYYSITNPAQPVLLGFYQPDTNRLAADAGCGGFPTGSGPYACPSQDQVALVQRPDGRVLSLSTEPGASSAQSEVPDPTFLHGDLRIVDVTNPGAPIEVGSYPNAYPVEQRPPGYNGENSLWSNNGCRPFNGAEGVAAYPDGSKALLPFYDAGLLTVDLTNPAAPATLGQYQYPTDRNGEGNAAYANLATVGGRSLALVGEQDWIAPSSSLRIDGTSSVAGSKFACEAMFTLFDPNNTAQVYRHPGSRVAGGIVYVGLGQPGTPYPAGVSVRGMIAFRDKNIVPSRQGPGGTVGSTATAVKRLQDDGAIGVIVGGTSTTAPQAISADGNPTGITIPTYSIDTADATALRDYLCPAPATPPTTLVVECGPGGQPLTGAMVDGPGSWGALRVLDVTNPTAPTLRGIYHPPPSLVFPPPDLGVYSVHNAVASGSIAYVAAHANGVRAVDLTSANPTEIASFVPSDLADPTMEIPAKADVTGVGVAANGSIVVSDINSGLYVLALDKTVTCLNLTAKASRGLPTTIQLSCTDVGRNAIRYRVVSGPAHGKLGSLSATGQVTYTANAGYSGPDSFTYDGTASDGTSNPATVSITVTSAPVVSDYRITNKVFAVGRGSTPIFASAAKATKHKQSTTFKYTLSEPATVKLVIGRLLPGRIKGRGKRARCVTPTPALHGANRCTQVSYRGTLTRTSHAGVNRVAFSGRIGSNALKPGSYEATLTATSRAGLRSKAQSVFFRIVSR